MHPRSSDDDRAPMWVTLVLVVGMSLALWTIIILAFRSLYGLLVANF